MTPDLVKLRAKQKSLRVVLDNLELTLVDEAQWTKPSDTSYLNDASRANPDVMANVAAMAATNTLVAWFGEDSEGFVGLWRGVACRPLASSPVVKLDTEGQYEIVAMTVPDYIAISVSKDDFDETRKALVKAGLKVGRDRDAIWAKLNEWSDDPNEFRNSLYDHIKKKKRSQP
jgi:hypothetical protein